MKPKIQKKIKKIEKRDTGRQKLEYVEKVDLNQSELNKTMTMHK